MVIEKPIHERKHIIDFQNKANEYLRKNPHLFRIHDVKTIEEFYKHLHENPSRLNIFLRGLTSEQKDDVRRFLINTVNPGQFKMISPRMISPRGNTKSTPSEPTKPELPKTEIKKEPSHTDVELSRRHSALAYRISGIAERYNQINKDKIITALRKIQERKDIGLDKKNEIIEKWLGHLEGHYNRKEQMLVEARRKKLVDEEKRNKEIETRKVEIKTLIDKAKKLMNSGKYAEMQTFIRTHFSQSLILDNPELSYLMAVTIFRTNYRDNIKYSELNKYLDVAIRDERFKAELTKIKRRLDGSEQVEIMSNLYIGISNQADLSDLLTKLVTLTKNLEYFTPENKAKIQDLIYKVRADLEKYAKKELAITEDERKTEPKLSQNRTLALAERQKAESERMQTAEIKMNELLIESLTKRYAEGKDLENLVNNLEEVIKRIDFTFFTPENKAKIYELLSRTHNRLKNFDDALVYGLQQLSIDTNPESRVRALFRVASLYVATNKPDKAIEHLKESINMIENNKVKEYTDEGLDRHYYALGLAYARTNDYAQAMEYLEKAYQRNKTNYNAVRDLAKLLESTGNKDRALTLFREALALSKTDEQKQKNNDDVERLAKILPKPTEVIGNNAKTDIPVVKDGPKLERRDVKLDIPAIKFSTITELMKEYRELKDKNNFEGIIKLFEANMSLIENDRIYLGILYDTYKRTKNTGKALEIAHRLSELYLKQINDGVSTDVKYAMNIFERIIYDYAEKKQYDEGIQYIQDILATLIKAKVDVHEYKALYLHLGAAYDKKGDKENAILNYRLLLEYWPDNSTIRTRLAELEGKTSNNPVASDVSKLTSGPVNYENYIDIYEKLEYEYNESKLKAFINDLTNKSYIGLNKTYNNLITEYEDILKQILELPKELRMVYNNRITPIRIILQELYHRLGNLEKTKEHLLKIESELGQSTFDSNPRLKFRLYVVLSQLGENVDATRFNEFINKLDINPEKYLTQLELYNLSNYYADILKEYTIVDSDYSTAIRFLGKHFILSDNKNLLRTLAILVYYNKDSPNEEQLMIIEDILIKASTTPEIVSSENHTRIGIKAYLNAIELLIANKNNEYLARTLLDYYDVIRSANRSFFGLINRSSDLDKMITESYNRSKKVLRERFK